MCTLKIIIKVYETTLGSVTLHRDTTLLRNFYDTRVTRISIKIRLPGWEEVLCQLCKLILSRLLDEQGLPRFNTLDARENF